MRLWALLVIVLLAVGPIAYGENIASTKAQQCDQDVNEAKQSNAQIEHPCKDPKKCGNEECCIGPQGYDKKFQEGKCSSCVAQCKPLGTIPETYKCDCTGGNTQYCKGSATLPHSISGNMPTLFCTKNCYEKVNKDAEKAGKDTQMQTKDAVASGSKCELIPNEESKDCQKEHNAKNQATNDNAKKQAEDAAKKAQDAKKKEGGMPKLPEIPPKKPEPPKEPPQAPPTKTTCDPPLVMLNGACTCPTSDGTFVEDILGCHAKDISATVATVSAKASPIQISAFGLPTCTSCAATDCFNSEHKINAPDERRKEMNSQKTKSESSDTDLLKDKTDPQMTVSGAEQGDQGVDPNNQNQLSGKQANARVAGAQGSDQATGYNALNPDAQNAVRNQQAEFPRGLKEGGDQAGSMGAEGGPDPSQIMDMISKMAAGAAQGGGDKTGSTQPGSQVQVGGTPGTYVQSVPNKGAVTYDENFFRMCQDITFYQKNVQCKTYGGALMAAANGGDMTKTGSVSPEGLASAVTLANPSGATKEVAVSLDGKQSDIVLRLAAMTAATVRAGQDGTLKEISNIPGIMGAAVWGVSATRTGIVDLTDDVEVIDHDTLTLFRRPYDSTVDEKPIADFWSGKSLDKGFDYPSYRRRPEKSTHAFQTRISYYRGDIRSTPTGVGEVNMGKTINYITISPNQDSRIDLWGRTSYVSMVAVDSNIIRGLSTMVDQRNIQVETVLSYYLNGNRAYDYIVDDGNVFRGDQSRIIESSSPPPALPPLLRKVVYK